MIAEGKIKIDLGAQVTISSNRTAAVASLFVGRKVDEALDLLPLIYSLCAEAHISAARAAMGLETRAGDHLLVLAENAREHLLRIMLGWNADSVTQMPAPPVMSLIMAMRSAIGGETNKVAGALDVYLKDHVLGCDTVDFLKIETVAELNIWIAENPAPAAVYLQKICEAGWQGLGLTTPAFLPELPPAQLLARLDVDSFCLQPDWLGKPRETGPLSRQNATPLIQAIQQENGCGLLARLVARLVELARIPAQMRVDIPVATLQNGFGVVETARGRLFHAARVQDGVIRDYKILAPTEWNFHPAGVAAQALTGLDADKARAVVAAIDPCVDFELRVA